MVVVGTAAIAACAPLPPAPLSTATAMLTAIMDPLFLTYFISSVVFCCMALLVMYCPGNAAVYIETHSPEEIQKMHKREERLGVVYAAAAACLGTLSVTLSKICVLLVSTTLDGNNQFWPIQSHWLTYVFFVSFIGLALVSLIVHHQASHLLRCLGCLDKFIILSLGLCRPI